MVHGSAQRTAPDLTILSTLTVSYNKRPTAHKEPYDHTATVAGVTIE